MKKLLLSISLALVACLAFFTPSASAQVTGPLQGQRIAVFCANTVITGPLTNGAIATLGGGFSDVILSPLAASNTNGPVLQLYFSTTNTAAIGTNTFALVPSADGTNFSTLTAQQFTLSITNTGTTVVCYPTNLPSALIQNKKALRLIVTNGDTNSLTLTATLTFPY